MDTDERIAALVDRRMYEQDAQYHAEVARLRQMLRMVEMALYDEGISGPVAERIVNRLVYGVPDPGAGYTRQQEIREHVQMLATTPLRWPS